MATEHFGPGGGAFLILSWIVFRTVKRLEIVEAAQALDRASMGQIKDILRARLGVYFPNYTGAASATVVGPGNGRNTEG